VRLAPADDEPLLRRGLRVLLETDDRISVVAEASNGAELVDVVATAHPDVVLVDVKVPGVDAWKPCACCKRSPTRPSWRS
jgi:DNA-binding NarL/FixJ family response regulator